MGCRPSKQATSKVRAVDESLCLCSPRKVRKNHKCSGSTSKPLVTGSKKHSLSSGHRPRSANGASMDFPAFSTTTAVYRKSASKTSKITLRLSCDGSTLEIEQCDYDLEKACGDQTPTPRPWHSAPNLTKLKDKRTRLFREEPMKHSTSTWSPSVSSTVSGCHGLTMRVPVIINATENQNSDKSLAASHRSSNESQAGSGSSQGRSNTGKTPLLKTACKPSSDAAQFTYRNFCDFSSDIDRSRLGARMSFREQDYTKQSLNSRSDNTTRTNETSALVHEKSQTTNNKHRSHGYKVRDDSESSAEFEQIPVNVITSYGPPSTSDKTYGTTDSNHNPVQLCLNSCCSHDKRARPESTFLAPHFRSVDSESKQSSLECLQMANMFTIHDFSSHEDMSTHSARDESPVNFMSQIDSSSILSFVALGCPVLNDISNFPYSSDDEAPRGMFTPQPGIIDPYDSLDDGINTSGIINNVYGVAPGVGCLYTGGSDNVSRRGSRKNIDKKSSAERTVSRLKYVNGFIDHKRGQSEETAEYKKETRREWIDGELRLVKDDGSSVDDCSTWASNCWSRVKFPVLKTHVSASSLLNDAVELKSGDVTNECNDVVCCSESEAPSLCQQSQCDVTENLCQPKESSVVTTYQSTDIESVDNEVKYMGVVAGDTESTLPRRHKITENTEEKSITLELSTIRLTDEASLDVDSINIKLLQLMPQNIGPSFQTETNIEDKLYFNVTNAERKAQETMLFAKGTDDTPVSHERSLINIDTLVQDLTCCESSETESIDSSQNLFVLHDFQDDDEIDSFKDTPESQQADYLMELLTSELTTTSRTGVKESMYSSDYQNFLQTGLYSMTNSSESESSLMKNSVQYDKLHNYESVYPNQHIWTKPVTTTSLHHVKINILNQNLSSLDPSHDLNSADLKILECKKSMIDTLTSLAYFNKDVSQENMSLNRYGERTLKDADANGRQDFSHQTKNARKSRSNVNSLISADHGAYTAVHTFENRKYLKMATGRQIGQVNDHLTETTTTSVIQLDGHKQASGVDIFGQDTTGSNVSTSLCPSAPSLSQTQSDFKGMSVSIQAHGERPPGTHFERHLNEGGIDPSKITYLALEEKCPTTTTTLNLPFQCNVPRCSPISQDSSNRFKKTLLCKNGPRDNESIGSNGGHDSRNMETEAIYIETEKFFGASDCQKCEDIKGDAQNSSSKSRPQVLLQSSFIRPCKDPIGRSGDVRLQNMKQVSNHNESSNHFYDSDFLTKSVDCNSNDQCKENSKCYSNDIYNEILNLRKKSHTIMSSSLDERVIKTEVSCNGEMQPLGSGKATHHCRASSYPLCSSSPHNTRPKTSIHAREENYWGYNRCLFNQRNVRCSNVYISGNKHYGNSNHAQCAGDFGGVSYNQPAETVQCDRYPPIKERIKLSNNSISSTSTFKHELLESPSIEHSLDIISCRRQAPSNVCYKHFTETSDSDSIPRNSVLSLVRYFEKVPYLTNNTK
ncbi:hypothetical protein BgiBS90_027243 [Biomphalaria glabrata]|nr:hypothetical protein BgiBS90_027243 [Biomphalaria glabrata]